MAHETLAALAALAFVLGPPLPSYAEVARDAVDENDDGPQSSSPVRGLREASDIERASRRALEDGLAYLARRQAETEDGSFPRGDAREWAPVGITALGALAFMAGGNSPGRGPHGREVEHAIEYLLQKTDLSPRSDHLGYISTTGDITSRTHGHGFATLALAEAYGMSPQSATIKRALTAAVRMIETSQGAEGGWYYAPQVESKHEGSVTICYVQALRAARNSGIRVRGEVVQRAEDYVRRLQKTDGTFRYQLDREDSSVALTAAGVATLNMTGTYDDVAIQNGIDAIWSGLAIMETDGDLAKFPYYQRLYLAQALWQLTDASQFESWWKEERQRIVRTQDPDGSWSDRRYGRCYATAVNCLVLAIPEGLLPIFQR